MPKSQWLAESFGMFFGYLCFQAAASRSALPRRFLAEQICVLMCFKMRLSLDIFLLFLAPHDSSCNAACFHLSPKERAKPFRTSCGFEEWEPPQDEDDKGAFGLLVSYSFSILV